MKGNDDSLAHLSLSPGRVEGLSDAVFAIIMTLLVLELIIPELIETEYEELGDRLNEYLPRFTGFILSFIVLGMLWILHHFMFHYINHSNGVLLWLNNLFLLSIAFIPFSTAIIGRGQTGWLNVIIYEFNLLACQFFLYALWLYVTWNRRNVDQDMDEGVIYLLKTVIFFGMLYTLLTIAVSIIDPGLSLNLLTLLLCLYIGFTMMSGHHMHFWFRRKRKNRRNRK